MFNNGGFAGFGVNTNNANNTNFLNRQNNGQNNGQLTLPQYGMNLERRLRNQEVPGSRTNRRRTERAGDYNDLPRGTRREPTTIEFESLLRSSEQLLNEADIPITTLKRSLVDTGLATNKFEVEQRTRSFLDQTVGGSSTVSGSSRSLEQNHNRAKKLLSAHGMDVERHQQAHDLIRLQARTLQGPDGQTMASATSTDIGKYLQHYQNGIVNTAIRESLRQTETEAKQRVTFGMTKEWEAMRKAIRTKGHLKTTPSSTTSTLSQGNNPLSTPRQGGGDTKTMEGGNGNNNVDSTGPLHVSPDQRSQMIRYAEVLRNYHATRTPGDDHGTYDVAKGFETAVSLCDESDPEIKQNRAHSWELLSFYMGERTTNNATTTTNKHQFRADYGTPPLKQLFAKRAVTFLEHQFFNIKISQRSANNQATPFGAALNDQGRSNKAAMHEILNVLAAESNMGGSGNDTGDQIWKKLYYCIRCGVDDETDDTTSKFTAGVSPQLRQPVEAALHHLKTCRGSDGNTTTATASYGGNKPEWATRLYSASMGVQPGTYQFAVLKLLSQCGGCLGGGGNGGGNGNGGTHKRLESLQLLNFQVQDYMWQRLVVSIATSSLLQHVQERYHVRDLAQTITAFGPKHFSPNNERPLLYFQVLLLAQEFELALDYLVQQHRQVDAVHFALALHHYGALRVVGENDPVQFNYVRNTYGLCDSERRNFDYLQLVSGYVQSFSKWWPGRAADYYVMLEGPERIRCLTDLIVKTRNHNLLTVLVGSPYDDHKSVLEELLTEEEYLSCMESSATLAQHQGECDVSVTLYHRCKKYTHAMAVLNKELSSVMRPTVPKERRDYIEGMARNFVRQGLSQVQRPRPNDQMFEHHSITLKRLLNMSVFFKRMESQEWSKAHEAAAQSRIVNVDASRMQHNVQETIRTSFNALDNAVKMNVALFLTEYMRCLYELFQFNVNGQAPSDTLRQTLHEIRRRADIVFQHAVCIQGQQYQFSTDDQNKLMKYLSLMKL